VADAGPCGGFGEGWRAVRAVRSMSLRKIAAEVQIPVNTVRTIVAKANGADRITKKRGQKLHPGEKREERSYVPIGNQKLLKRVELEHVPSQLNQGDSLRAKDERVYRH